MLLHHLAAVVLFLSLGLDTLAVAVGLGMAGLQRRDRLRFGVSFALAEGIMPLVGFAIGKGVAAAVGGTASILSAVILLAVGLYMVWESLHEEEDDDDEDEPFSAATPVRLALTALSVSLDELAVGFSLGLFGIPVVLAAVLIAGQAFLITLIGTAVGKRLGEAFAEHAELAAGIALSGLAVLLLGEHLLGAS